LAANQDGISWKNMPAHILKTYPDWFPEFKDKSLARDERKRFGERLRKMARDTEK